MRPSRLLPLLLALVPLAAPAADRYPVPAAPPDVAARPADAAVTPSGLATRVLVPGKGGPHPAGDELATVEYTLWTPDGKLLDSTAAKPRAWTRPLSHFIPGLREGLSLMTPGEKRRMWMPHALTFPQAPDSLVVEIELVAIGPSPFLPPADLAGPGDDAQVLKSGLVSRVLQPGKGSDHPGRAAQVTVHYTGWTTDGRMFDSSWTKGRPISFALDEVIKGWTEGLQLMTVGQKNRFWIPEKLAYRGEAGKPAGRLVFDVELLEIGK